MESKVVAKVECGCKKPETHPCTRRSLRGGLQMHDSAESSSFMQPSFGKSLRDSTLHDDKPRWGLMVWVPCIGDITCISLKCLRHLLHNKNRTNGPPTERL